MKRILVFGYGVVAYVIFLATVLYAAGFVGNLFVPKSMDSVPRIPFWTALIVDMALLGVFALQHSVMARPAFKAWWTRIVPEPAERSTYVLFSNLALILLFWQWQPMGGVVWDVQDPVARAFVHTLAALGWLLALVSTFLINHFDLFGLRQVWLYLRGGPYTPLRFATPGLYKMVRHPLYLGWLLAFWATPTMTATHLVFAIGTTAYIFIAIQFEERDMVRAYRGRYAAYRKRVPMILPWPWPRAVPPSRAGVVAQTQADDN